MMRIDIRETRAAPAASRQASSAVHAVPTQSIP